MGRMQVLRNNSHVQCDILLQSMFTHLSAINGIIQKFQNGGEVDIHVLVDAVTHLTYVVNNVYSNLHTSPTNEGMKISDDDDIEDVE